MQSITIGDATLHVETDLRPGRPNVVFVNSLGSDLRIWDDVVNILARENVGSLRYDLRGHGLSDLGTPPKLIADHVADLAALMRESGLGKATICGVSVGGTIALGLADAYPDHVETLVLCCTGAKIGTEKQMPSREHSSRSMANFCVRMRSYSRLSSR